MHRAHQRGRPVKWYESRHDPPRRRANYKGPIPVKFLARLFITGQAAKRLSLQMDAEKKKKQEEIQQEKTRKKMEKEMRGKRPSLWRRIFPKPLSECAPKQQRSISNAQAPTAKAQEEQTDWTYCRAFGCPRLRTKHSIFCEGHHRKNLLGTKFRLKNPIEQAGQICMNPLCRHGNPVPAQYCRRCGQRLGDAER